MSGVVLALAMATAPIHVLTIEGPVTPIQARYLARGIRAAEEEGAGLVVLRVASPGGLVDSMNKMVASISNARVPVVAHVAPRTAHAASAGAFLVIAADVAAMAPGTRIGSAHPVGGGGEDLGKSMAEKAVNDLAALARSLARDRGRNETAAVAMVRLSANYTAEEAKETGLVEILAEDEAALLAALDGLKIVRRGAEIRLAVRGAEIVRRAPSRVERILGVLADPTLAAILLSIGVMGLVYEASSPGIGFGAIVGSIALLLGLVALSVLPIRFGATLLLLLGLTLVILEAKFQSKGLLTLAGGSAILLGGMYFLDEGRYFGAAQTLRWGVLAPTLLAVGGALAAMIYLAGRALAGAPVTGAEALVGMTGEVRAGGLVFLDGALWNWSPESGDPAAFPPGAKVVVTRVESRPTRLVVKKKEG